MLDYETLRFIAWLAVGILIIAFAIMDGHDMGVGILLPILGKTERERCAIINSIAPRWDGRQVWLVSSIAIIFAIWPIVYRIVFPALYWAILLLLAALLLRPIAYEYRAKIVSTRWREFWDWIIFTGSAIPSILIGIAFGNLLLGIPFRLDGMMHVTYEGSFFKLFHPFALFCGVISLSLQILQGSSILALKAKGALQTYAIIVGRVVGIIMLGSYSVVALWVCSIKGIIIDSLPGYNGLMTSLLKTAYAETGAWLNNYKQFPILWITPVLVYAMVLSTLYLQTIKNTAWAFITSSMAVAATILTAIIIIFPFVLPSSIDPAMSITLWDGSTSYYCLAVVLVIALILIPIIITCTANSYCEIHKAR